MSIWRSAQSILGAFFVVVVLVGLATALSSNLMLGGMGPDVEITVAFKHSGGVKRLLLSFAPLEKMD